MTGNKYEVTLDETQELFGQFLSGARCGALLVTAFKELSDTACNAFESSARALGYETDACTFADVSALDENALFMLVEGLDPKCLVAADESAASLLSRAYRCEIPTGEASRALGRTCVAFADFEAMLKTPDEKQIAWALLKKLPKAGER